MATTISAELLRELHRIHRQLSDLRTRIDRGPRQVKAAQAMLAQQVQECEKAKAALFQARKSADERQLQLKIREDRIRDLQGKLNACATNREYQALKEQIAADEQANSVLSDEILETLEKIDMLQGKLRESEIQREKSRQDLANTEARVAEQSAKLQSELDRVQAELRQSETQLPEDFRPDYARIIRGRGEEALAAVEGESCSACCQILSPQTMNELYMSKPVFCKSCGAVLYLPEDRSPGKR